MRLLRAVKYRNVTTFPCTTLQPTRYLHDSLRALGPTSSSKVLILIRMREAIKLLFAVQIVPLQRPCIQTQVNRRNQSELPAFLEISSNVLEFLM